MKILAFTDMHGSAIAYRKIKKSIKKNDPDLIICPGDISIFEQGLFKIMRLLNRLDKKILLIHGNHEESSTMRKYAERLKNIIFLHKKYYLQDNFLFLGYGGGGFEEIDKKFEKLAKEKFMNIIKENKDKKVILMTHGPPYRTRLDKIGKSYCGSKSYRKFLKNNDIDMMFCGHIHENFGKKDKINKTIIMNPGPFGKIIIV